MPGLSPAERRLLNQQWFNRYTQHVRRTIELGYPPADENISAYELTFVLDWKALSDYRLTERKDVLTAYLRMVEVDFHEKDQGKAEWTPPHLLDFLAKKESVNHWLAQSRAEFMFRRQEKSYVIVFRGKCLVLKDYSGLPYVWHLLRNPNTEIPAVELELLCGVGSTGHTETLQVLSDAQGNLSPASNPTRDAVIDEPTVKAIKQYIAELKGELENPTDPERAIEVHEELNKAEKYLRNGIGVGFRPRQFKSEDERAWRRVKRNIDTVLAKILEHNPELTDYLRRSIQTGSLLCYRPDPNNRIEWTF